MEEGKAVEARAEPSPASTRARFVIDARRSRFTVQAFATGVLSAMGHNPTIGIRNFSGEVEFDREAMKADGLRLVIPTGSLEVLDDIRDRDRLEMEKLMRGDVLEVAKYPQIAYEASDISLAKMDNALYSANITGQLNFHGVTRHQPIAARIMDSGEMLRISGDFTLRQSDFQIKPVSVAGGALKLKDELKFTFEMIARKQDPTG
jgi:polyisoprenoid-binding protein YceI